MRLAAPIALLLAGSTLAGQQTIDRPALGPPRHRRRRLPDGLRGVGTDGAVHLPRVPESPDLESICDAQKKTERPPGRARRDLQAVAGGAAGSPITGGSGHGRIARSGQIYAYQGEMAARARRSTRRTRPSRRTGAANPVMREATHLLELSIAVANLRRGELENCLTRSQRRAVHLPHQPSGRASAPVRVRARRRVLHQGAGAGPEEPRDALAAECRLHDARASTRTACRPTPDPRRWRPRPAARRISPTSPTSRACRCARAPAAPSSTTSTTTAASTSSSPAWGRATAAPLPQRGRRPVRGRLRAGARARPDRAASTSRTPTTTTTAGSTSTCIAAAGSIRCATPCCATTATGRSPT